VGVPFPVVVSSIWTGEVNFLSLPVPSDTVGVSEIIDET